MTVRTLHMQLVTYRQFATWLAKTYGLPYVGYYLAAASVLTLAGLWGTREPQLYVGRRLRDALLVLADHWGARGRDRAPMRAERIGE